jgi:hypothetical protein
VSQMESQLVNCYLLHLTLNLIAQVPLENRCYVFLKLLYKYLSNIQHKIPT